MESPFANSAASATDAEATAAYVRALLEVLGDREPLAVLAAMPAELAHLVAGFDEERLRRPERPGKWSIHEVAAHLADSELVMGYRMRRILADEHPRISGYDQDGWARRLGYRDTRIADSLATFGALRAANLRLLHAAAPTDWQRVGLHTERGEESLAHLVRLYAAHDLVHLRQIVRIAAATA